MTYQDFIKFKYTNHRGITSIRTVRPQSIFIGHNIWHPEEQWLLYGYDQNKNDNRTFALKDCDFTVTEISVTSDVKDEE